MPAPEPEIKPGERTPRAVQEFAAMLVGWLPWPEGKEPPAAVEAAPLEEKPAKKQRRKKKADPPPAE